MPSYGGTSVAPTVKPPTLDFGSGRDLTVEGSNPGSDSARSQSLLEILSLPLPLPPLTLPR